jgi:RNA polymerase-interacting CarD/CdnL/TRCF family regulator
MAIRKAQEMKNNENKTLLYEIKSVFVNEISLIKKMNRTQITVGPKITNVVGRIPQLL